jgi:hypothetical protein
VGAMIANGMGGDKYIYEQSCVISISKELERRAILTKPPNRNVLSHDHGIMASSTIIMSSRG